MLRTTAGVTLLTVTDTAGDVVVLPAASVARAVMLCGPFVVVAVFQLAEYGAVVSVTVSNVTPAVVLSITSLNGHGQIGYTTWTSWVDVSVADQSHQPVAGVTVTFAVTGGTTTTRTCTTATNGTCSTVNSKVKLSQSKRSVTYTTATVAKPGATWDGTRWGVTLQLP